MVQSSLVQPVLAVFAYLLSVLQALQYSLVYDPEAGAAVLAHNKV